MPFHTHYNGKIQCLTNFKCLKDMREMTFSFTSMESVNVDGIVYSKWYGSFKYFFFILSINIQNMEV